MGRVFALDVGDKTIGVAMSDAVGITAQPLIVLRRTDSVKADLRAVEELAREHEVCKIVIGLPFTLAGEEGVQAGKIRDFVERLTRRSRIPVVTWDERLTTVLAERALLEAGESRADRRRVVDKVAAAVLLQSYLAAQESSSEDVSA